jgi:hypothetical protein
VVSQLIVSSQLVNAVNPKYEIRRTKQILNPNAQMFKTELPKYTQSLFWSLGFKEFEFVSDFDAMAFPAKIGDGK